MHVAEIIEHRCWVHESGRTASVFGAVPWTSEAERAEWRMVCRGWTWRTVDAGGREAVGLCRPPAKTPDEAVRIANRFNELAPRKRAPFTLRDVPMGTMQEVRA